MIDINLLREHPEVVRKAATDRYLTVNVDAVIAADHAYRESLQAVETLRRELNAGGSATVDATTREKLKAVKQSLKEKEAALDTQKTSLEALLKGLPNIQKEDVPVGKTEEDNAVVRTVGTPIKFSFTPKDYLTIASHHDLIDLERGAKVSGTRFAYLKNEGALLSLALKQYAFDLAVNEGFQPVLPPVLINESSMAGMGYLEHGGEDETYHFEKDGLYLVGTSEQAIGPMHASEIFEADDLPRRYVAFSSCFRREAGSYGKDTRGIIRVHQFDKVELFSITTPESSDAEHEYLLSLEERFMQGLKLPYRVVKLCTGDIGWPSARTYDIETWIPSEGKYRETHSTSTTTDFQSRRLKIRYREKGSGEVKFAHMLNGTLVAINRPLAAILEMYQQADGTVLLPDVLHPYLFGRTRIG